MLGTKYLVLSTWYQVRLVPRKYEDSRGRRVIIHHYSPVPVSSLMLKGLKWLSTRHYQLTYFFRKDPVVLQLGPFPCVPWNPPNEAGTEARAPFSLLAPVPEKVPKRPPKCSLLGTVWAPWAPECRFWAVSGTA